MESLITDVNWTAVIVGGVGAWVLGALWFSETLFGAKWREGVGSTLTPHTPMAPAMITQAVGTFLFAWVVGITETTGSLGLAILVGLTIATLIKANGFFAGKGRAAIMIETGFVLAMLVVMILAHALF